MKWGMSTELGQFQASFVIVLKRKSGFAGPEDIGWYIASWREYFGYSEGCFFGFWKYGDGRILYFFCSICCKL